MLDAELELEVGDLAVAAALRVAGGECLALAGPSGAGKTSILRAIAGLVRPKSGRILCGTHTWLDTPAHIDIAPERRRCGFVFQDYALFPHLSAWRNAGYALPRAQRRATALELLERFGVATRADARPHELSGGERQRVALARALAAQPSVLLLDEPLAALDATARAAAARELAQALLAISVPAIFVTHDFGEAALLASRIAVVDAGRVVQEGSAGELAARPRSPFVAELTGAVVLRGSADNSAGLTSVALDGGGRVTSTDVASGRVAVSVHPWEIALLPAHAQTRGSMQNRVSATVTSVTQIGSRVRVGLDAGQPLVAEVTAPAVRELELRPGIPVAATWKASATRLVPL